jgi:hypothetical protein
MNVKSNKKKVIARGKTTQNLKNKRVTAAPLPLLPFLPGRIAPRNIEEAKKILSRLISSFVRGKVTDHQSKTLCYLLTSFVMMVKDNDFESRLQLLESTMQSEK